LRGEHAQDYAGLWLDAHGRVLDIMPGNETEAAVTIAPGLDQEFYRGDGLHGAIDMKERPATVYRQGGETPRLMVEIGVVGLGPTYQLTFAAADDGSAILIPHVGIGLYDDFEDNLGVPWAFPLAPYRRASAAQEQAWLGRFRSA
jgi:hypothetical protein